MQWKVAVRALLLADVTLVASLSLAGPAAAQTEPALEYNLPAQDLGDTLRAIARESGREILFRSEAVAGRQAPPLKGRFTADAAIRAAIAGSDLTLEARSGAFLVRGQEMETPRLSKTANSVGARSNSDTNIVVTGTHVRGAPVASPVIRIGREEIKDRGQASLAEVVRTIPQNFGGGQNPGIGNNVPETSGVNVGSATSVNLRGLGSDATLTLVDGHRFSYSASRQAVDISMIPLGAVERIEIVPDGASALYGSDAVAGVVNVLLRSNFTGLETSARLGGATDGGDFEQRYGVTAGTGWGSGSLFASYEFARTTAILGRDRSYTAAQSPALTLFPFLRSHSAALSGRQDLGGRLSFTVDALVNQRTSRSSYALNSAGDIALSGAALAYDSKSFVIAPTLKYRTGGTWNLFASGSLAQDHVYYDVKSFSQGAVFDFPGNCYCNQGISAEIGGDGTLFRGAGGPIKLAAGAGYRSNRLDRYNGAGATTNVQKTQDSYYGYAEISLPLVSADRPLNLVNSLSLSAAGRYERYPGVGSVVTPKLGAIYSPSPDFTFKGSWGKSFRAPTLYQQYQNNDVVVARPASLGGSGFPAGTTAIFIQGGRPDLKPERATSWAATFGVHPRRAHGLSLEATWFNTRYKDRVVTPIIFRSQALSNPLYAGQLTFNPDAALVNEIVRSGNNFVNLSGAPFDPAKVAVLVDNRNVNAGLQRIRGADLLVSYNAPLPANAGAISAQLDATYLKSDQQLTASQPIVPLAGIIFGPPHFRMRGDLGWTSGALNIDAGISRIGKVTDTRRAPTVSVHGMTTLDLTARLKSGARSGVLRGLDASLTVQNLFNAKPARIFTTLPSDAPYDSTNYSPVGRFVAASLTKSW